MKSNSITLSQYSSWILVTMREAAWAPLSVFSVYLVCLIVGLYDLYPNLDIPTHILGGIAITYFYRAAIRNSQKLLGETPFPIQVLFAFTATGTTVIFWEFAENIVDFVFHTHNVFGLFDTLKDMFNGLLGALVLTLFYRRT